MSTRGDGLDQEFLELRAPGWEPEQPGLIADLEQGHYFELAAATPDSSS